MRPLLALAVAATILFSVHSFVTRHEVRETPVPSADDIEPAVANAYSLEVTPSFAVTKDPFALQATSTDSADGILVRQQDRILLSKDEGQAGVPMLAGPFDNLQTRPVKGLEGSKDIELFVSAQPPLPTDDVQRVHFLRIRLLTPDPVAGAPAVAAERVLTSERGGVIAGIVVLRVNE